MVQLHLKEPSSLKAALRSFTVLEDPVYANKQLGLSGQLEVMACDCQQHAPDGPMCAEDSNCINRLTYMECTGEHCGCDMRCANRRFQNHEHAKIDVFNAGPKGYGVRAMQNMAKGTFIAEYTGEVLDEARFQRRQKKYDEQGVKHFYFMMLQKDEFIDATEKGSVARFCNHSCNPNAAIEKWVVGPRLRMGLFAKRDIKRGEEISFDYKVDRYGATAQPCYCGEQNCSGFLGGRTQTSGVSLPPSVIEGLGLDSDSALSWPERAELQLSQLPLSSADRASVLKTLEQKKRSKTAALLALLDGPPSSIAEDDAVATTVHRTLLDSFGCEPLTDDVPNFLRVLFQSSDRSWLASLMLSRVLKSSSAVDSEILRLHGYEIMGTVLNRFKDCPEVVVPALEVLTRWPKLTRNKISSSKIESIVQSISELADGETQKLASSLVKAWGSLEIGYRIPKRRSEPVDSPSSAPAPAAAGATAAASAAAPGAATSTNDSSSGASPGDKKSDAANLSAAPSPVSDIKVAATSSSTTRSELRRRPLPPGWQAAQTDEGRVYYVNEALNRTTWEFPKEVREAELGEQRRERERREQQKQETLTRMREAQREAQQEEIRRIIEASESVPATPTALAASATPNTPSSVKDSSRKSGRAAVTQENTPITPKRPRKPSFETILAAYVPKLVFVAEEELGHERCKRHARDIVHALAKKEENKKTDLLTFELTAERKKKIKGFVKEYMAKVTAHHQRPRQSEGEPSSSKRIKRADDKDRPEAAKRAKFPAPSN